jgi:hypothetical protein
MIDVQPRIVFLTLGTGSLSRLLRCISIIALMALPARYVNAQSVGPSLYDASAQSVLIPTVAVSGQLYQNIGLHLDDDGAFRITSVGPQAPAATALTDKGAFYFPQSGWVTLPKVQVGSDTYTNALLQMQSDGRLSLKSIVRPITGATSETSKTILRLDNAITVPNHIPAIKYPESYSNAARASIDLTDPHCNINPTTESFPADFLGQFALPVIRGAPLSRAIERGMWLKDSWDSSNSAAPTLSRQCPGDMRQAGQLALRRLKTLGVDYVGLIPWTCIDMSTTPWRIVNPAELRSGMNDSDLEWMTAEAHRLGLSVHWSNQIQCGIDMATQRIVSISFSEQNVRNYLDALEPYLLSRAALFQRIGVDVMDISCRCWAFFSAQGYNKLVAERLAIIAPKIKSIYSGKLRGLEVPGQNAQDGYVHGLYDGEQVRQYLDYFEIDIQPDASSIDVSRVSVDAFKDSIRKQINYYATARIDNSKPVTWYFRIKSIAEIASFGVEEGFCTDTLGLFRPGGACIQQALHTDYSVQAAFVEAALEVIAEQTYLQTRSVETDYWLTDNVLPDAAFPNIATSIRNKPSEAILYQWYAR